MSERESTEQNVRTGPANVFSPRATAVAGFTFAVLSMIGQGTWGTALQSLFFGSSYSQGSLDRVMVAWGFGSLLVAALGFALAFVSLQGRAGHDAWDAHLARAAVIVSAVGAFFGVVTIIGGLIHHL
jgi:hypothetical protein